MLTNRHENTTEWPKLYAPFAVKAIQKYAQAIKMPTRPPLHICIMMCSHLRRVIPKLDHMALWLGAFERRSVPSSLIYFGAA